jgi:hypothetical protein
MDALNASIDSRMAPSARKAWQTSGDDFGVVVPICALAARLPTSADAGGSERFVAGGHTAIGVGGEFFILTLRVDPHLRLNSAAFMTREALIR